MTGDHFMVTLCRLDVFLLFTFLNIISNSRNFEMYSVFMSYGPGIRILSPRFVVAFMRDKMCEAADMYDQETNDFLQGQK